MRHRCHAINCRIQTKPEKFMCGQHWAMLPETFKRRLLKHYRPGQCQDWQISSEYSAAAQACVKKVAELEGVAVTGEEDELRIYKILEPQNWGGPWRRAAEE